jgi:hypothetical protein
MTKHTPIIEKKFRRFLGDANEALMANLRAGRNRTPHLVDVVIEAARERLRESLDAAETLEAIREIASNLLGCENMVLLCIDRKTGAFYPFWSFGIDAAKRSMMEALEEPASYCAALGSTYIARDLEDQSASRQHPRVTVFVPIRYQGEIKAVLALLQFLPQKLGIDMIDNEIFRILSEEAGSMLFPEDAGAAASGSPERQS